MLHALGWLVGWSFSWLVGPAFALSPFVSSFCISASAQSHVADAEDRHKGLRKGWMIFGKRKSKSMQSEVTIWYRSWKRGIA